MAVSHVFSNAVVDWTGTVTVHNSQGSTTTAAATGMVRPVDWNSAHNQFYTLSGNTNNASTASGTNVVLQGVGAVTLIGSTNTIGISVANPAHKNYWPYDEAVAAAHVVSNGTMLVQPARFDGEVQHDRVLLRFFYSNASNSTGSMTFTFYFGLYTRNVSTLSLSASTSSSYAITFSGTVGNQTLQAGPRLVSIPWTQTVTAGDYWAGIGASFATAGVNNTIASFLQASKENTTFSGIFGAASNTTIQRVLGMGRYTSARSTPPDSLAFSHIGGESTAFQRPIIWGMISQTA